MLFREHISRMNIWKIIRCHYFILFSIITKYHHHHLHVPEGLGVFPVP